MAPGKVFSYSATFANNNKAGRALQQEDASAQKFGNAPASDVVFTLPLPTGVTVKSYTTSPKVATAPVVQNGELTWNLSNIKAGGKIKVNLKMMAAACSTPDALDLTGEFAYQTLDGPKRVNACLTKPLYVWANGCDPIPSSAKGKGGSFTCECTDCQFNGKRYSCAPATCQCASN